MAKQESISMQYIENTTKFQLHDTVVCLGKFDGIHIGHRYLIQHMLSYKEKGYDTVLFTFALHPSNLFSEQEIQLIDTIQEKQKKLENLGVDVVVSYPFTEETANMSPEKFIENILIEKLDAKVIVVGKDFCFGHKRTGNIKLLKMLEEQYGYQLIAFDKLEEEKEVVSSSRIRKEIEKGNMELVSRLLGQPYSILSEVVYGKQLGRTLGIPTINQIPSQEKLLPPNGVYISKIHQKEKQYFGITNIGYKPTIGEHNVRGVETHIFDYRGDLYGQVMQVDLYSYVRGEKKFNSIEELKKQMEQDIEYAKSYFEIVQAASV